ncbi:MAG: hypothetical protein KAT77_04160 [Nanoarchaeota archaeon]|nr:hypothetical protein [Nanoarchaeota archaeon]
MKRQIIAAFVLVAVLLAATGCIEEEPKPYSPELEERIGTALSNDSISGVSIRPDYLPREMFALLPEFPEDFYQMRSVVRSGRIVNLGEIEEKYWMQPEFFPNFEEIGLPLLQNPPVNRWGAYGYATYPADTVSTLVPGETLEFYFFMRSSYLVETYQGIWLETLFPSEATITTGASLLDGSKSVTQNGTEAAQYFTVEVAPNPFVLEPNFPIFRREGISKVKVLVTALEDTPPGNYIIALDTGQVPEEYSRQWLNQYLNLYVEGSMTKISRPYHQAFITVVET